MITIAQIGLGYWGKNIQRNLNELKILHTACDANLQIIEERRKQIPQIKYTTSSEDIFNNAGINAVVISTPAATHYELVKKALKANKDVFVEKPLALNVAEGEELVKLADKKDRILMVGHILHIIRQLLN